MWLQVKNVVDVYQVQSFRDLLRNKPLMPLIRATEEIQGCQQVWAFRKVQMKCMNVKFALFEFPYHRKFSSVNFAKDKMPKLYA